MTIVYPLTPPQVGGSAVIPAESIQFTSFCSVAKAKSSWTGQSVISKHDGLTILAQVSLPALQTADARAWIAFLLSLNGPVGTFWLGDPSRKTTLGNVASSTLLFDSGNGQTGQYIKIRGAVANRVGVLMPGDVIQIGNYCYTCLSQGNADATGKFLIDIFPSLRGLPADGTSVVTTNPKGLFRLIENTATWTTNANQLTSISFSAEEAI